VLIFGAAGFNPVLHGSLVVLSGHHDRCTASQTSRTTRFSYSTRLSVNFADGLTSRPARLS
jgi:hypothetical protein